MRNISASRSDFRTNVAVPNRGPLLHSLPKRPCFDHVLTIFFQERQLPSTLFVVVVVFVDDDEGIVFLIASRPAHRNLSQC